MVVVRPIQLGLFIVCEGDELIGSENLDWVGEVEAREENLGKGSKSLRGQPSLHRTRSALSYLVWQSQSFVGPTV